MVKIDTGKAGGPYEMTIEGKNTLKLKNILVGEVWVCSGQSNMEFELKRANTAQEEIADANNYPQIRLFTSGKRYLYADVQLQRQWLVCNSQTAGSFSAVGYFFGRELNKQLNVPVGLINTSWGGTPAESWMSKEYLENDPNFQPILKRFEETAANYPELYKKFIESRKQYEKAAQS